MADALPTFHNPPLVETVLGVQFDRIPGFTNAHLGAFWKRLRGRADRAAAQEAWTKVADAPPIQPSFEQFENEQAWTPSSSMLRLTQDPASRLRITNSRENAMIQLQNGRLHYNWIGRPREEYPRYTGVRPEFDRVHAELCAFLTEESLESLRANQWEVTYVNHIPRGSVWNDPGDWAKLFSGLLGRSAPHEARLESLSGAWHFEIPDKVGRLHIDLKHARLADGPEVLRLTLTARGPVDDRTSLSDGLDRGRKAIVCTFRDITSRDAQRYWGLES